jgi:hypothetical protein
MMMILFRHSMSKDHQVRCPAEPAFDTMIELFNLYLQAIVIWYRSGEHEDGVKMCSLRGAYEDAVSEWYSLQ